jgi:hypothetical protein
VARAICAHGSDPFTCGWTRLLADDVDGPAIATVLDDASATGDDAWVRVFPALAGKTLVDGTLTSPTTAVFAFKSYPPYELTFPIDWKADPEHNDTWTQMFQSLAWLRVSTVPDELAAAVIVDWAERVMASEPPLFWTWVDAAAAKRLNLVADFFDDYVADHQEIDRRLVRAAGRIILTHLYAMSTELCYTRPGNHGMMQDISILQNVGRYPHLADADALRANAERRTLEHAARSISADGVHVEHSPDYQALYLGLILNAIDAIQAAGDEPPAALITWRDGLVASTVHLLQPDLTFPQFGDTENSSWRAQLARMVKQVRKEGGGDPAAVDQLDWVLTAGVSGRAPVVLDRVYPEGGYAAFRDRWDAADPTSAITGHFTCHHFSKTHYHKDETSFELYGHGTELIVDSGKYDYDQRGEYNRYQKDVFAHNVLVVDDATYSPGKASIVASGGDADVAWVQGTHDGYRARGIRSQVRTFAHRKPSTFVVIDTVEASGAHRYAQHFHLAPALSSVEVVDDHTVIASAPGGPTLVISPVETPTRVELLEAWYFAEWGQVVDTTDVVFRYDRSDAELSLPVVITIAAPGAPAVRLTADELARAIKVP